MKLIKYFIASTFLLTNVVFGLVPENEVVVICPSAKDNKCPEPARKVAKGNAKFAFDLYKAVSQEPNCTISPFSASSCMAMISMAAVDETLDQIQQVMHFPKQPIMLDFGFRWINEALTSGMAIGGEPVHFTPSNTIWTQKGMIVSPAILTKIQHFWDGGINQADFMNDPSGSLKLINDLVEEKTNGNIKDFLPEGTVNQDTRLVALNTIYLKAPWKKPFNEEETKPSTFNGSQFDVTCPFMHKIDRLNMVELESYSMVEIPFADSMSTDAKISLMVILPNDDVALSDVEASLDAKSVRKAIKAMETRSVDLHFPVISMESTTSLKPTLMAMGLTLPFSPEGGFPFNGENNKLVLNDVIQTVKFDFNEWGATCVAATAGMIGVTSYFDPTEAAPFNVNRPFIYLVVDQNTRSILFMGKVSQPNL